MTIGLFLVTALMLGMRHALDPDHVVAVSALVAEERRMWPAARLGALWGLGHLLPLALVGAPVMLLRLQLPAAMENVVDLGVGFLLVVMGVRTLYRLYRERIGFREHIHPGGESEHGHFHPGDQGRTHSHTHPLPGSDRRGLLTVLVGMVHGLAGSGAAVVLALAAAPSVEAGLGYLLVFGAGTCLGMFLMTLCIAAPALTAVSRFSAAHGSVRVAAGLASMAVGVSLIGEMLRSLTL